MSIVPPTRPHITCFFTDFTDCIYAGPTSLHLAIFMKIGMYVYFGHTKKCF